MNNSFQLGTKVFNGWGRLGTNLSRSERKARRELHNHAYRIEQAAKTARPRLVATPRTLQVISLQEFLSTQPTCEPHAELLPAVVVSFDKREQISEAL